MSLADIHRVLVVGAGTVGHGIAQDFARGGCRVRLYDCDTMRLDQSLRQIRSNLEVMVEAEVMEESRVAAVLGNIETCREFDTAGDGVELAIEAVTESPEVKSDVFRELERVCPEEAILASNTSGLDIFGLVDLARPQRLCIAHWYAPAYIVPLVDVVKGPQTSQETIDRVVELLTRMNKKPLVLDKFIPGYVINRLQVALNREVNHLLDSGVVTPEVLDEAVKASLAPRMMVLGLAQRVDFTGLPLSIAIQKELMGELATEPTFETIQALVDQGRLGVGSGKGFYDYAGKTTAQVLRERDLALLKIFGRQA